MGYRRDSFAPEEWYHCYTRSVERSMGTRDVFADSVDAERFIQSLHLANSSEPVRRSDLFQPTHSSIMEMPRRDPLVAVGAYCIMPTHFHLLLKELTEGGISKIMQTTGTAFSMYYNIKHKRIGNVFVKPFRSKHVADDIYFKHVINYIHLNPAELYEPKWKEGIVSDMARLEQQLRAYRFSSLPEYLGFNRPESVLIDTDALPQAARPDSKLAELLEETRAFYLDYDRDF